jgi:hypothetical protein
VLAVYFNCSLQLQQRLEFQRTTVQQKLMPGWILSMAHVVQIFYRVAFLSVTIMCIFSDSHQIKGELSSEQ